LTIVDDFSNLLTLADLGWCMGR